MASSLSNNITAFLNFVAVMCSIPVISAGIWLASNSDNQDHVTGDDYWADIRACLAADRDICPAMSNNYFTAELFFAARLSPLQSGCCKPPTICGYQYVSPTMWINPTYPMIDADCSIWNNDPTQLCYNCDSCKAGLLGNLRSEWRKVNVILIVTVVLLISVYFIACSAYKNAQTNKGAASGRK
nr:tetraspanin-2-like [Ipomoea batatas]